MSKNKDFIIIMLFVLIGMFIPFLGSMTITYGFNIYHIASTFGYFLLIFGIEIVVVYLYFIITNKLATKKIEKLKEK